MNSSYSNDITNENIVTNTNSPFENIEIINQDNSSKLDNSNNSNNSSESESQNNDYLLKKAKIGKQNFIILKDVCKVYINGEVKYEALKNINFSINEGELVIILGASGSGKSTCLNAIGGMDTITSGTIIVDGYEVSKYDIDQLVEYRRKDIGFVFQFYNLIQNLTSLENIELSTEICNEPLDPMQVLTDVGLKEKLNNFPSQLSGGEQQRISIARAIAKNPKILLCDEPTGALDYNTGKQILSLLQQICYEKKITVIIITHNNLIAPIANRVIHFKSGCVTKIEINPNPKLVGDLEW